MPIIINLPYCIIKTIMSKMLTYRECPRKFESYLQRVYDEIVLMYLNKIRETQNGLVTFTDEDGRQKTGRVRRNGKKKEKTFALDVENSVTIKLIRFRCDSEHVCRDVFLNIFVPYCKFFLTDMASILSESNDIDPDSCFMPNQLRYIKRKWKQWQETFGNSVYILHSVEDYFHYSADRLNQIRKQLFQIRGFISAHINVN